MKVKVYVKHVPLTKTEQFMQKVIDAAHADLAAEYAANEELLQENKDLRVEIAHLKDEMEILHQQIATACADRDNFEASFKQMTSWWEQAIHEKVKVEEELHSTQVEVADRNERVFILEQRIEMLEQENKEWTHAISALKEENAKYRATVTFAKLNAAQEEVTRLQNEVARLTNERDAIVRENTDLFFRNTELEDELTAAINLENEYAEQISELRKQLNIKDSSTRNFWNFLVEHSIVKTEDEMGGTTNGTK